MGGGNEGYASGPPHARGTTVHEEAARTARETTREKPWRRK
ncbi:hypothetical protein [Streptomyces sp. WAC05374]|nr:hypothetical protein [Streptomyces sp. WAC05374]